VIVVHAIDVGDDLDALRQGIKDALEAHILRFTRKEAS
jgi:multicomponent Na+:H+ antiporter subunit E